MPAYGGLSVETAFYPAPYAVLHVECEVGVVFLQCVCLEPLQIGFARRHLPVVAADELCLSLGIEVGNCHVAVFPERRRDVRRVHVLPGAVYDVALLLVLACAVHTADGLYGVDVLYLLVEEEGVELVLVEAGLQLVHHDDESVLGIFEVLYHLFLCHAAIERG